MRREELKVDLGKLKNRSYEWRDRRREVVDATLEALRHTVGRDEHMPFLHRLVEARIGR